MHQMQRLIFTLALLLPGLPALAQQQELEAGDRLAIRAVIERQLEAFRNDDAAGAFTFASPEIQAKFGTAEHFMTMVKTFYQPVYRPQYVTFRDLDIIEGVPTQPVLLAGSDGVPVIALYVMQQQPDGVWKIDGCYLVPFKGERL